MNDREQILNVLKQLGVKDAEQKADEIHAEMEALKAGKGSPQMTKDEKDSHRVDPLTHEIMRVFEKHQVPMEVALTVLGNAVAGVLFAFTHEEDEEKGKESYTTGADLMRNTIMALRDSWKLKKKRSEALRNIGPLLDSLKGAVAGLGDREELDA